MFSHYSPLVHVMARGVGNIDAGGVINSVVRYLKLERRYIVSGIAILDTTAVPENAQCKFIWFIIRQS